MTKKAFWKLNLGMNISTLAKILGASASELRETGMKHGIYGFGGRNTRIPYNSAVEITKILQPDKLSKLKNDDKIYLSSNLPVREFAESINKPIGMVLKTLLLNGVNVTMNETIDYDTASLIADELNVEVFPENGAFDSNLNNSSISSQMMQVIEYDTTIESKEYTLRPPVVTVMGHVDHGKTTLLDTIRSSNVVATEAGAITQHISSYKIEYKPKNEKNTNLQLLKGSTGGYKITFIDTPGHEAFTAMRARGSQVADFIILVVSSVEGPKPQTVEVIERAKISNTPVIVALNKIDLPGSDLERTKTEIAKYNLVPEEWGGTTPFIPISAKTGENLDLLLETLLQNAELIEPKGEINCPGQALVIESHLDNKLGVVTTAIVVKDKIQTGDAVRAGIAVAKIRKLESTEGKTIPEAVIGDPIIMLGLSEVVDVGEALIVYPSVKLAQNEANKEVLRRNQTKRSNTNIQVTTDNQINLVLKADVSGSLEAIKESIIKIPQDKVKLVIKSEGVGAVTENDADFAATSSSTILAFHTQIPSKIEEKLKVAGVAFVQSDIIYELLEWVEGQVLANTKHETKEVRLGQAKVLAVFKSEKAGVQVFGGEVIGGKIFSNKELKLLRGEEIVGKLEIVELQKNKVKVEEINISQQFGISVKGKGKIQVGDIIECFDEVLVK